ncbi:hypothetical protein CFOL_v3_30439 [Cephalotus follicularis]|uniref:Exo_endo_phos domain-containing protein n=1 Tax=Cephalotus follicularis TaxID=3775 RepID=A0A1Q3D3X9_CEPFO|nr:hypothetical protein CFOL_v3_30439 [Cephalotus follicularis]
MGDFNVSRYPHEHSRMHPCITKSMHEFNDCITTSELEDIRCVGNRFTWSNKRAGRDAISKKIDRALGNWEWFRQYTFSVAHFMQPGVSAHSPIVLQLSLATGNENRPCKFSNIWADHQDFLPLVAKVWAQNYGSNPLEDIILNLKQLKGELKSFNRKYFHKPEKRVSNAREELVKIQEKLDTLLVWT